MTIVEIGFIGLGVMGRPMAHNLIKAGHALTVTTSSPAKAAEFEAAGARVVGTPREVAAASELVITMLPNTPQVREVALGPDGVAAGAREGSVLVDMSSIEPGGAREIGEELAARGVAMLDAPVSGGEPGAIAGTLAIMVGGDEAIVERVRPVLLQLGTSAIRVGPLGAGNVAKLANQAIVAVNIAVLGEALLLADRAGVDPAAVLDAIGGGLAGSNVMKAKGPMMLTGGFDPGFRVALHAKDLDNALATGHDTATPLPLTAAVREMLTGLAARGLADRDHSALIDHYETLSGTALRR